MYWDPNYHGNSCIALLYYVVTWVVRLHEIILDKMWEKLVTSSCQECVKPYTARLWGKPKHCLVLQVCVCVCDPKGQGYPDHINNGCKRWPAYKLVPSIILSSLFTTTFLILARLRYFCASIFSCDVECEKLHCSNGKSDTLVVWKIAVNDFDAEKSARCSRVLGVTELVASGDQCIEAGCSLYPNSLQVETSVLKLGAHCIRTLCKRRPVYWSRVLVVTELVASGDQCIEAGCSL